MKKFIKILKKTIKIIGIFILFGIFYSFGYSAYENIRVNQMIKSFKNRADFETEVILFNGYETYKRRYYKVSRETLEENDNLNVFTDELKHNIGQKGDIYVTKQSPFPHIIGVHQLMSFYAGGHAAIMDGKGYVIESTGYPENFETFIGIIKDDGSNKNNYINTVDVVSNDYWLNRAKPSDDKKLFYQRYYRSEFIGLRIKNLDQDKLDQFVDNAYQKYEDNRLYNFLFFLDMEYKYYCTDLISRAYSEIFGEAKGYAKRLNDDGFITTVHDLILSKETYISMYFELTKENDEIIENIYYLEDVE